jgi:LPXTG-motif cell wall-anchored protein
MRLQRTAFIITLTGALSLAPMAATADSYPAPEVPPVTTSLPGTDAVLGDPFTLSIAAADGTEVVLTVTHDEAPDEAIQIAGTASHAKIAQGGGTTFYVTLHHAGTFTLVASVDGEVIATHAVTVVDPADASAADTGAVDTGAAGDSYADSGTGAAGGEGGTAAQGSVLDQLPATGTEAAFFGVGALLLLGAGTTAVIAARRRSRA